MVTNRNASIGALAGGGSTATNTAAVPQTKVTAADLYPLKMQNMSDIEGKSAFNNLQFPADRGKYYMTLGLNTYQRGGGNLMSVILGSLTTEGNIILPLPQQMVDSHSVNYEQQEIGQFTGAATETISGVLGRSLTNIEQGSKNLVAAIGTAAGKAFDQLTGGNVTGAARALTGLAPNQFLTVLLKGPQYKKHSFTWKLSPRNPAESESIRYIIETLNNAMAPGISGGRGFFKFPKVVALSFMPNSNVLYRFKPCIIENMTVNYAPSGAPAFYRRTEAPDTVELKLDFMELEFWLAGDFGGNSINTSGMARTADGRVRGGV